MTSSALHTHSDNSHAGAPHAEGENLEVFIHISDQRTIPKSLLDEMIRLVEGFIPLMLPGHRYTLETMVGNAFWDSLTNDDRKTLGRAMAHLVAMGEFPLVFGKRNGHTQQYQLPE